MPSELATRTPRGNSTQAVNNASPGSNGSDKPLMMMPSELGYVGGLFSESVLQQQEAGSRRNSTKSLSATELTQPPSRLPNAVAEALPTVSETAKQSAPKAGLRLWYRQV